jgi:5-methylcytosine-specific restriction protein A
VGKQQLTKPYRRREFGLYGTARWQRLRMQQLQREPLCRYCQQRGVVNVASVADHIVPHKGDTNAFWFGELQSLCKFCHDSVKAREELAGVVGCGTDGLPNDPGHHWGAG